ncbi:MAG TPA: superoxide dismutase [Dehalococcoidia bacterium]|nr:superoxide dismutase [Dehalococcoidia bacterium]
MPRFFALVLAAAIAVFALESQGGPSPTAAQGFPAVINLPAGWLPEGIVTTADGRLYSGSRRHGGIYEVDLSTGAGRVVVPQQEGRIAVGLSFDERSGFIFVAGGPGGAGYVYDSRTGRQVASFHFTSGPTFVNDVIVTAEAAYFTDSMQPVLYRVPLGSHGQVATDGAFEVLSLSGDYVHLPGFNANGIEVTEDSARLIIVQSNAGRLFTVDPESGRAASINLDGYSVANGDGILLEGRVLYVVRNQNNLVAQIALTPDFTGGVLLRQITDPRLDVPTTIARFGGRIYAVNARFAAGTDPSLSYTVVGLEVPQGLPIGLPPR